MYTFSVSVKSIILLIFKILFCSLKSYKNKEVVTTQDSIRGSVQLVPLLPALTEGTRSAEEMGRPRTAGTERARPMARPPSVENHATEVVLPLMVVTEMVLHLTVATEMVLHLTLAIETVLHLLDVIEMVLRPLDVIEMVLPLTVAIEMTALT